MVTSGAATIDEKARAASGVERAFGRLLAIMENYPQLRSAENVNTLMSQLEGTENRVSVERKRFNAAVAAYTLKPKRFPSMAIARLFGFGERAYFDAAAGAEQVPQVAL